MKMGQTPFGNTVREHRAGFLCLLPEQHIRNAIDIRLDIGGEVCKSWLLMNGDGGITNATPGDHALHFPIQAENNMVYAREKW